MSKITYKEAVVDGYVVHARVQTLNKFGKQSTLFIPKNTDEYIKLIEAGGKPKTIVGDVKQAATLEVLEKLGLDPKKVFQLESDPKKEIGGIVRGMIPIKDATGENDVKTLLGHGTEVRAFVNVPTGVTTPAGVASKTIYLNGLQILNLVRYEAKAPEPLKMAPVAGAFVATAEDQVSQADDSIPFQQEESIL